MPAQPVSSVASPKPAMNWNISRKLGGINVAAIGLTRGRTASNGRRVEAAAKIHRPTQCMISWQLAKVVIAKFLNFHGIRLVRVAS